MKFLRKFNENIHNDIDIIRDFFGETSDEFLDSKIEVISCEVFLNLSYRKEHGEMENFHPINFERESGLYLEESRAGDNYHVKLRNDGRTNGSRAGFGENYIPLKIDLIKIDLLSPNITDKLMSISENLILSTKQHLLAEGYDIYSIIYRNHRATVYLYKLSEFEKITQYFDLDEIEISCGVDEISLVPGSITDKRRISILRSKRIGSINKFI